MQRMCFVTLFASPLRGNAGLSALSGNQISNEEKRNFIYGNSLFLSSVPSRQVVWAAAGAAVPPVCCPAAAAVSGGSSSGSASGADTSKYTVFIPASSATLNPSDHRHRPGVVVGELCDTPGRSTTIAGVMREGLPLPKWGVGCRHPLTLDLHLREGELGGQIERRSRCPVTAHTGFWEFCSMYDPGLRFLSSNVGLVTASTLLYAGRLLATITAHLNNAENGTVDDDGTTHVTGWQRQRDRTAADGTVSSHSMPRGLDSVGVTAVDDHNSLALHS